MGRTTSINVNGENYSVGWNESGWFAMREDGVCSREYCETLDELRQAVADGDWETVDIADLIDEAELDLELEDESELDLESLYAEIGGVC